MTDNPLSGRVPLNLRKPDSQETLAKSTSFRPGIFHKPGYRNPNQEPHLMRNEGCTPLRRYPNGTLDCQYVAQTIVDLVHKIKNSGSLTSFEQALLSTVLPGHFQLVDPQIAATMVKITDDERMLVALSVVKHFNDEKNWNAGYGRGGVVTVGG
jgi:hypothetical protein